MKISLIKEMGNDSSSYHARPPPLTKEELNDWDFIFTTPTRLINSRNTLHTKKM